MQSTHQNIKVSNKYENSTSYNILLSLSACLLCKHKEGVVIFGCIYNVFVKKYFIRVWFWINLIKKGKNKKTRTIYVFRNYTQQVSLLLIIGFASVKIQNNIDYFATPAHS